MIAKNIQEFQVWHNAKAFGVAVNAILGRPTFSKDFDLRNQIRNALDSVTSNMEEGFEQPTDRAFAKYLYTSKGSTAEVCGRLRLACERQHLSEPELRALIESGDEILRMTTGLIKYLHRSNRKDRGIGKRLTTGD